MESSSGRTESSSGDSQESKIDQPEPFQLSTQEERVPEADQGVAVPDAQAAVKVDNETDVERKDQEDPEESAPAAAEQERGGAPAQAERGGPGSVEKGLEEGEERGEEDQGAQPRAGPSEQAGKESSDSEKPANTVQEDHAKILESLSGRVVVSKKRAADHSLSDRESEEEEEDNDKDGWKVLTTEHKSSKRKKVERKPTPRKRKAAGVTLPKSLANSIAKTLNKLKDAIDQQHA